MIDWSLDLDDPVQYEQHRKNMVAAGLWVDRSVKPGDLAWYYACLTDSTL